MFLFDIIPVMVCLIFLFVIGFLIFQAVAGFKQWNKNEYLPRLTVPATVVAKRTNVSRHHHRHSGHASHVSTSTSYYATFQFASGDRLELHVSGYEYGMLVEGDQGELTFQGTRYLGFQRK